MTQPQRILTLSPPVVRDVQVGSRRIHLEESGRGHPVLLLHGGGPGASGSSNYSRNVGAFARRFRSLVPDMPGYGKSSKGLDPADPFGDLADSMLGLLDALEIERAHVIGNSLGGACALRMALERPDRVSALVLMGPGGIGTSRSLPTKGLRRLLEYYAGEGPTLEKMRSFVREFLVFDGARVPDELIAERFEASRDPEVVAAPPLRRPTSPQAVLRLDLTRDARLARCETPTLVLWGAADAVNRPTGARMLQTRMRNCDVHLFANTGHWVQWERADEFDELSTSFLERHTPPAEKLR